MKQFTRTIENFKCENCGQHVTGNGYTNHCPHCLYSKHVDISPGDRQALCQGLMRPIGIEQRRGKHFIIQKCLNCRHTFKIEPAAKDNFDKVLELSTSITR